MSAHIFFGPIRLPVNDAGSLSEETREESQIDHEVGAIETSVSKTHDDAGAQGDADPLRPKLFTRQRIVSLDPEKMNTPTIVPSDAFHDEDEREDDVTEFLAGGCTFDFSKDMMKSLHTIVDQMHAHSTKSDAADATVEKY